MFSKLDPVKYYFDNSRFGWAIKNSASRYVYANSIAHRYFNIPSGTIAGTFDTDLTPDISDYYHHFLHDDKKILKTKEMSIVLKTFEYGRENRLKTFMVEKRPWTLSDGSDAIICTYLEITNLYFSTFLRPRGRKPFVFTRPAKTFTDREWEVILLLFCGVKQNLMPEILGISAPALRNRLIRCYDKTGVTNIAALKQHCMQEGWDNYIPPFFLNKGHVLMT
ncbi:PAS domain-containing protein [Pantoea sp. ARC607]|uniref:PAS domain-containing protein n=1 Tax=unclassified Pantoea TaxID=2630326 RepID=UPI000DA9D09F|nr:PAS domain-containing protein [Pantoea sp. ARC607]PZL92308.1 LuxR family transcriptional regulator [Pantoea sp. ARC607]